MADKFAHIEFSAFAIAIRSIQRKSTRQLHACEIGRGVATRLHASAVIGPSKAGPDRPQHGLQPRSCSFLKRWRLIACHAQRLRQRKLYTGHEPLADPRLRMKHIPGVIQTRKHGELAGHPSGIESPGVVDVFVIK